MHTIGYLEYLVLSSLFTLGACGCPRGANPIALSNFSGDISSGSGWKAGDKCEWKLFPPSDGDHYKLRINITYANCNDRFKIEGKPYCKISTPHTLYYVEQKSLNFCGACIENQRCFQFDNALEILFQSDGKGFSLKYEFFSCTRRTESLPKSTSSSAPTPPSDPSTGLLISIFVPVVIILAITVVILVAIVIKIPPRQRSDIAIGLPLQDGVVNPNAFFTHIPQDIARPVPSAPSADYIEPETLPNPHLRNVAHYETVGPAIPSNPLPNDNSYMRPIVRTFVDQEDGYQAPIRPNLENHEYDQWM